MFFLVFLGPRCGPRRVRPIDRDSLLVPRLTAVALRSGRQNAAWSPGQTPRPCCDSPDGKTLQRRRLLLLRATTTATSGHRLLRTLARTRVGLGPLAAHRKVAAVAETAVAADLNQALDIELDLTAQFTLNTKVADLLAQSLHFSFSQLPNPRVRADAGRVQDLLAAGRPNTVDVGESDFDALVAREVNTFDTCHIRVFSSYCGV